MIPELTTLSNDIPETACNKPVEDDTHLCASQSAPATGAMDDYLLDEQVGYLLRLANQRHLEIFSSNMPDLTPTQFAVLIRLNQEDSISQNELGRRVGIDAATTNGVIERLARKKLVQARTDAHDKRRLRICLSAAGRSALTAAIPTAQRITQQTLNQLDSEEATQLIRLLKKLHKT